MVIFQQAHDAEQSDDQDIFNEMISSYVALVRPTLARRVSGYSNILNYVSHKLTQTMYSGDKLRTPGLNQLRKNNNVNLRATIGRYSRMV